VRRVVESTFVTLDGVISSPEKWGPPYWDDEHAGYARKLLFAADALLLGRVTYEGFAQAWPSRTGDEYSDRINSLPKHVASRTLREATWNATVLQGDVAEEVAKLKQHTGENILKFGTGELDRTLLEHDLVDEFHFWLFPVAAGAGQRLFDGIDLTHLNLVDTTTFKSGIVVLTYAPPTASEQWGGARGAPPQRD
jgi:dihydrofolate reductase